MSDTNEAPRQRKASKIDALEALKGRGLKIDTVIDVGIYHDTRELRQAFPDAFHLLFEPLAHLAPTIEANYQAINHRLMIAACSDVPGEGALQLLRHNGPDQPVTHSILLPTPPAPGTAGEFLSVPIVRVDDTVRAAGLTGRFLLKVDVDGRDMDVLKGSAGILDQVDVVVIECLHSAWLDRVNFLYEHGFRLADVVDLTHYDDMFWQMDMVFISARLQQGTAFHPYRGREVDLSLFRALY